MINGSEFRIALLRDGAVWVPHVFGTDQIQALRARADQSLIGYELKPPRRDSPIAPVYPDEAEYREAILSCAGLLEDLGFGDPRWIGGGVIPKWQGEGRRAWHVDWWGWENSPQTWRTDPPQVGVLCYLDGAGVDSGALIIAPGSHRREVWGHETCWENYDSRFDERVVPADAGDVVILDARVMHAVMPNRQLHCRRCVTLWFLLDFDHLHVRTRATAMMSVDAKFAAIGARAPAFEDGDWRTLWFPHVKKPQFPIAPQRLAALRENTGSDRAIVGESGRPEDAFLDQEGTYGWYWAAAAAKAPNRILELGVKWGYSLIAMLKGARWAGVEPRLVGVDAEADGLATNAVAQANLEQLGARFLLFKISTADPNEVGLALGGHGAYDVIHIDADHSAEGVRNELQIAYAWIKPKGVILIDDVDVPMIRALAEDFCSQMGIQSFLLPTAHQVMVIDMAKRTRFNGLIVS